MFYNQQEEVKKNNYKKSLEIIGSLSKLFSDSRSPYLYYRVAEKLFCKSFLANDLSRGDVALDALKDNVGIGLKTFLANNDKSFQKVAEFNKDRYLYEKKSATELVKFISTLRNERIMFTENVYAVENSIYHCVVRKENTFKIYEEKMHIVDILNIRDVIKKRNSISFNDGINDYSFSLSKSTLNKRFITTDTIDEFDVKILQNPLKDIQKCLSQSIFEYGQDNRVKATVYLPLYGKEKKVFPRSGMNQWNASGRVRDVNEVYIPIPSKVHHIMPSFFPNRDAPFNLKLPNGDSLQAKVCQDNSKALMSYSNRELGKWILRDVLKLNEGELLTYEKLQLFGIDSVRIDKIDNENYDINFASLDSYENYISNSN